MVRLADFRKLAPAVPICVLAGAPLTACAARDMPSAEVGAVGPTLVTGPTVIANPNTTTPLTALVELETDVPTLVTLTVDDGDDRRFIEFSARAREHLLPLLGLKPARTYEIGVLVADSDGRTTELGEPLRYTTDALPEDFPPLDILVSRPEDMEPGVILFDVLSWSGINIDASHGLLIAVDAEGDVVWYHDVDGASINGAARLEGGTLTYLVGNLGVVEIDMLGNPQRIWGANGLVPQLPPGTIALATDTVHHDLLQTRSGNFLTLSSELRVFDDYPVAELAPVPTAPANVVGTVVVEFEPGGAIVQTWPLFDMLDPRRHGYGALSTYWDPLYLEVAGGTTFDWGHANSVDHRESDDVVIVSLRHQDAVVAFDRSSGGLRWILGSPANWMSPWDAFLLRPGGESEFPYHQHSAKFTPEGTLILFDNGNFRASPYDQPHAALEGYSRIVEYRIDETALTATEVWSYGGNDPTDEHFYSTFLGDVDWLPRTGNVLVTDGGRIVDDAGNPSDALTDHKFARVVELRHSSPPEKVFELVIDDPGGADWSSYRSVKLPDLYPETLATVTRKAAGTSRAAVDD